MNITVAIIVCKYCSSSPSDNDESIGSNDSDDHHDEEDTEYNDDDESFTGITDFKYKVLTCLSSDGWDFTSLQDNHTATVFPDGLVLTATAHTPMIFHSGVGPAPSWKLNYPALAYLMNGQYYSEYLGTLRLMGLPVMSEKSWDKLVAWLAKHVENLAMSSCRQVRENISKRGDMLSWVASFDGFYLTRGHHSNNSSATLHDFRSDKIAWFAHRTKRGQQANWQGTSAGAEGDMLRTILEDVKAEGFKVAQIVMDHDTSGGNIACDVFPEVRITYCGNHTAKTFHQDLTKIKSIPCKVNFHIPKTVCL